MTTRPARGGGLDARHGTGLPMSDLPPLPTATPGFYRHYKGGEYELLGVVRHSETLEPLVLYRPLHGASGSWVRPYAMFFESVVHEGRSQPRFALQRPPAGAPADDRGPRSDAAAGDDGPMTGGA